MAKVTGTPGDDFLSGWNFGGGKSDAIYGLEGDDRFSFDDISDGDRFYGGPGDDSIYGLDFFVPLSASRADRGIFFDGGTGYDTAEMELTSQKDGLTIKLGQIYGRMTSVEQRLVDVILDSQDGSSLSGTVLKGTKMAEEVTLNLDGGTRADDTRIKMGGGDDVFTLDYTYDAHGYGKLKVALGSGDDVYRSEVGYWDDETKGAVKIKGGKGDDVIELGLGREKAQGGKGDDVFVVETNDSGLKVDTLSGGDGEDTFLFNMRPLTGGLRAKVKGFESGEDRVVIENFLAGDQVFDDVIDIGKRDPFSFLALSYDPAEGLVRYDGRAILDLGAGTAVAASDFLVVGDYDLIA